MKKFVSLLLALALAAALAVPSLAVDRAEAQTSAQLLYNLGLFRGTGTDASGAPVFDLDRAPTRAEAVTMLVRLLGAEQTALSGSWSMPFTDVADWARPYVGYAYSKGLTKGIDATTFGSASTVTAAQYLTFLLRALGYQDGTDFSWSTPWLRTDKLGITSGEYGAKTAFLRVDAAVVSARALDAARKGSDQTLLEALLAGGGITDSDVVVWSSEAMAFEADFASFLFYPVKGSPATFTSFKVTKATVNGLATKTLQLTTPAAVSAYLASIGADRGGFGYLEVSYDQDAAEAAATRTQTDSSGTAWPVLDFTFTYTATQASGRTVTGTFTASYYLDNE